MRIPEQQRQNRSGQQFQEDLTHFLQPGAFTVLSSDNVPPPDPPMAPQPYRLATPNTRRHKNHSFAIIAEPGNSQPGSRSPSPSGRVSPFRGRGFNPAGSRHASPTPTPSPPPSEIQSASSSRSKIPKLTRRGSASVFGERIDDYLSSPNRRKLHSQLSQSLTNISTRKPPPSPRRQQQQQQQQQQRHSGHSRSFQRLSPIIGSSPEPSQSQSSPTTTTATKRNKPSSRSGSRYNSPSRNRLPPPSSQDGRNSRQGSRDPSPNKTPTSPSRIPVKNNYKNVQSKINSFNRNNKPKVPPKPQVLSETSDSSDINRGNNTYRTRSESLKKLKTNPKSNNLTNRNSRNDVTKPNQDNKNGNRSNESHDPNGNKLKGKSGDANSNSDTMTDKRNNNSNTNYNRTQNNNNNRSQGNNNSNNNNNNNKTKSNDNDEVVVSSNRDSEDNKKSYETPVKLSDLLQPSTTAVVSSTTTTVTQPLKIEAKMEQNSLEPQREPTKSSTDSTVRTVSTTTPTTTTTTTTTMRRSEPTTRIESKTIAPMVDGRVLSATSVSNAMNKMNDTVLDTQTLMKDHGISKLSPSVNAGDAKSNAATTRNNSGLDTKSTTTGAEMSETTNNKTNENNHRYNNSNNSNHTTSTGIIPARLLDEHVQNNMAKLIGPDNNLISNTMGKNINEMLRESRTVVADDVKPIRITVKEKPMDVDVQSGNIRFDAANGINERPSLPPTQPVNPNEQPQETPDAVEQNRCARFFTNLRNKFRCKRNNKPKETINIAKDQQDEKAGCFNCRKKKKPDVTINIENDEPKKRFWERFKCCRSKVADKSEENKRKDSWTDRRDSILSGPVEKKSWWRRIFCLDKCRKQKKPLEDPASRRASMMSKKKSLTSSVPVEDNTPKLDLSLVEHNSTMRGAIPVLPVSLAWFCLVMNCIIPGTGTIFSGIFCLCLGIPRFSQKDGPRSRLGAFIIDTIIGVGQCFTVLFCLVGWGWSIWWGVIMLKIAKKHRKIKALEAEAEKQEAGARQSSQQRDIEKGEGY